AQHHGGRLWRPGDLRGADQPRGGGPGRRARQPPARRVGRAGRRLLRDCHGHHPDRHGRPGRLMHRLNGEDAGFLYMDLPGQPMNSMAVGVLAGDDATLTLADVRTHLAGRLDELPSWRWRIVRVPGDLHHPVAVRDPDFDLDSHVREVTVAGGDTELEAWFATLAEEHLPTDRPLWQVWLVTGLDEGRQALVVKYHHALADGVGAFTTFSL